LSSWGGVSSRWNRISIIRWLIQQINHRPAYRLAQIVLSWNEFGFHIGITVSQRGGSERVRQAMRRRESTGSTSGVVLCFRLKPLLMPIVDLPFCSKPVGQITPVFTTSMLPKFVGSVGDLFFQAYVFVDLKNG